MRDKATLLYEWRQLRLKLKEKFSEDNLKSVITWWKSLDYHVNGFNYDQLYTWPDVWEYISEGHYTNSGNGLACFYTVHHAQPKLESEVWLIHDLALGDMYLVCYVDGYILNRANGKLEKYEDIKNDIDILEKYNSQTVIDNLKDSRERHSTV